MAEAAGTDVVPSTPDPKDVVPSTPEPPKEAADLFAEIAATHEAAAWTSLEKCKVLAAMIVAQRSKLVVEIGVWEGGSLIPQLLALKHLGAGIGVAIDSWSAAASIDGQVDPANVQWWGSQGPHDQAYVKFTSRLAQLGLTDVCRVLRSRSDDVDVRALVASYGPIDLCHIDGNHGDAAIRDVEHFAPHIPTGGLLVFDDLGWSGLSVERARDLAFKMGFVQRYLLGTGCVLQRVR